MLVDSIVCLAMRTTPKWSGPKLLVGQIVSIFVDCSSWFTFHWSFHRCCRCHCRRRRLRFEQVRSSLTLPPPRFWNRIRNHFRFGCKRLCLPCHYRYRGSLVICQTHSSGSDLHLSPALSFSLSHTHTYTQTHIYRILGHQHQHLETSTLPHLHSPDTTKHVLVLHQNTTIESIS